MIAFLAGLAIGIVLGAYLAWERYLRYRQPTVEIRVTPEFVRNITSSAVSQWLDERGLVWMPKGVDFKQNVKR